MKNRWIRRLAWISASLVLLLVAAATAVTLLFDPNDYKPQIAAAVRDATGRELTITGDIQLSLFPWLGVELGAVSLANPSGFGPQSFAHIEAAKVKVKLLPLFDKQIEISTVVLQGLAISLQVSADGRDNWSDLTTRSSTAATPTKEAPTASVPEGSTAFALPAALALGGLDVRDASLSWQDAASDSEFHIERLSLQSSAIHLPEPVTVTLKFDLSSRRPALHGTVEFAARVSPDIEHGRYAIDRLSLKETLEGPDLPGGQVSTALTGEIHADTAHSTVAVPAFTVSTLGLQVDGEFKGSYADPVPQITGRVQVAEFSPRALFKTLGLDAPQTTDPKVLSRAQAGLEFSVSNRDAQLKNLSVQLDDTTLRGNASASNFISPQLQFDLDIDSINSDRYLPPQSTAPAATPAAAAEAGAMGLPLDMLRALNLDGALRVGTMHASGLTVTEVRAKIHAARGLITLAPLAAKLYGGSYKGALQIDARGDTPAFNADETLAGIQAAPLVKDLTGKDLLNGTADIHIKAQTRGAEIDQMLRALNGSGEFSFRDGAVKGVNVAALVRAAKAKIEGQAPPPEEQRATDFTELRGTLSINNGIAQNNDLSAISPFLRVAGQGKADLVRQEVDYRLRIKIVDTSKGQGGAGLDAVKGVEIPIRVAGKLTEPVFKVDSDALTGVLRERAKAAVNKELDKEKAQAQEKLHKQEQKLKDRLKGLLK